MLYTKRYHTQGVFPGIYERYRTTLSVTYLILTVTTIMMLTILGFDIGKYVTVHNNLQLLTSVKRLTAIIVVIQLILLCTHIIYTIMPCSSRSDVYVLTLAVNEEESGKLTMYGTMSSSANAIQPDQILVFYLRAPGACCLPHCEPLTLPPNCWILHWQIICFFLSLIHVILSGEILTPASSFSGFLSVSVISMVCQSLLVPVSYCLTTDWGLCVPFLFSISRAYLHTDLYTQTLEELIKKSFKNAAKSSNSHSGEWFSGSVVQSDNGNANGSDRGGQVKMLQQFLETWHEELFREVFTVRDVVSLFLTRSEIDRLLDYYQKKANMTTNQDETVLYERK